MTLLIKESKIRTYFLKMFFPKTMFTVIAFACNAKRFASLERLAKMWEELLLNSTAVASLCKMSVL